MSINQKEKKIIDSLCEEVSVDNKMDKVFKFKWKYGTEIYAEYVTTDLDDNGLELEDPNYEDFICFIMKIGKIIKLNKADGFEWIKDRELFEFNYHNFPDEIYNSKGELISKRDNGKFNQDKN